MIENIIANAVGGLVTAIIVTFFGRFIKNWLDSRHPPNPSYATSVSTKSSRNWKRAFLITFVLFIVFSLIFFITDFSPIRLGETLRIILFPHTLPVNERLTLAAWNAFNEERYDEAIESAQLVTNQFAGTAASDEKRLEQQQLPLPPTGKITPYETMDLLSRGVLNDVATSYWIIGRSQEALGKNCEALEAYDVASQLTYARTWDPQFWPIRGWSPYGWFWSPSNDAEYRSSMLTCS